MKNNIFILITLTLFFHLPIAQAKTFYVTDKVLVGIYEQATTESTLIKALPTGTPIEVLERDGEYAKVRSPDGTTGWVESSYLIENKPAQLVVLDLTDQQKQLTEQLSLAQAELDATQKQLVEAKSKTNSEANDQSKNLNNEINKLKNKSKQQQKELAATKKQLQNKSQQHVAAIKQNKQLQESMAKSRKAKKNTPETKPAALSKSEKPSSASKELATIRAKNKQLTVTLNQVRDALDLPSATASASSEEGVTLKVLWLLLGALILAVIGFIAGIKWLDWHNLKRHGGFRI